MHGRILNLFARFCAEDCGFPPLGAMDRPAGACVIASARGVLRMPELMISPEKVAFLIEKAREFDVKELDSDPDSGSNGADDEMIDVLEDNGRDPVMRELTGFINALTEDEQIDLVALMRLGRGDGTIEEWQELRREAADGRNDGNGAASYLLGEPMLGDLLAEGLDAFGIDWTDEMTSADSSSPSERSEDRQSATDPFIARNRR
jgi:Protein of unknown function (DUF3775)